MVMADGNDSISVYNGYMCLITFFSLLPSIHQHIHFRLNNNSLEAPIKWIVALCLWMAIISMSVGTTGLNKAISGCLMTAIIPLLTMMSMYAYTIRYGINNAIRWMSFISLLIFTIQYGFIYNIANMSDGAHLMSAYYALFMLPLVLLHPSKVVRFVSVVIVTIVIFSSIKRGGFIALVAGLLIYILSYRKVSDKSTQSFIYALAAIGGISILFYFLATSEFGEVIERLSAVQDDEGSGRTEVWATTWKMIQQSDTLSYIIGHGNNAVLKDSPLYLSAHNDFLAAWSDYGFIALCLYIGFLLSLLKHSLHLICIKSPIAPSMVMLITFILVLTMISHVLTYYFMTLTCMTIGLLVGKEHFDEYHK